LLNTESISWRVSIGVMLLLLLLLLLLLRSAAL
jgi:hypothetical protein